MDRALTGRSLNTVMRHSFFPLCTLDNASLCALIAFLIALNTSNFTKVLISQLQAVLNGRMHIPLPFASKRPVVSLSDKD